MTAAANAASPPAIPFLDSASGYLDSPNAKALLGLLVTLVLAVVADRLLRRRVTHIVMRLPGDAAAIRTRWRTIRRLTVVTIVVVGVGWSLLNYEWTSTYARGILASSAVIAIVFGLAAQASLGNLVAGVMLSFSQPIRIGDRVTIEGYSGVVEEIGLTYTTLRADDGRLVTYPNTLLAQKAIENATVGGSDERVCIRVPLPPGSDAADVGHRLRGLAEIVGVTSAEAVVADIGSDGSILLELRGWAPGWGDARAAEDRLRGEAAAVLAELAAEARR